MTDSPPKFEDAPGHRLRKLKRGWQVVWRARTDLIRRGYKPKTQRVWAGVEPTEADRAWISSQCDMIQTEMLHWSRGGLPKIGIQYDGTIGGLIYAYVHDVDSPFHKLRYVSKTNYGRVLKRLQKDRGTEEIKKLKGRDFRHWHAEWTQDGKVSMAHSLIGMLRTILSFGSTILDDEECTRVRGLLHTMKFQMAPPRSERITADQVIAIRAMAHERGEPMIALAQAVQFELTLRQRDVIGEYIPISEKPISDIISGNDKWLRGLRWEEVDEHMVIRHVTSKRNKPVTAPLLSAPMIVEELQLVFPGVPLVRSSFPASGPIILDQDGFPFRDQTFRKRWRKIARAAGVPDDVRNMDSRAGAITEAFEAGVQPEHVRKAATHSNLSTTARYSRGDADVMAEVITTRGAHRNKSGTK